jgi:hypothetical protein
MKKLIAVVMCLGVLLSMPSSLFARDLLDAVCGNDGLFHTGAKLASEGIFRAPKFIDSLFGGDFERDYGYDGYRHGGYTHEYDYGHYGSGDNGYGYCHHGLDHNRFSGV